MSSAKKQTVPAKKSSPLPVSLLTKPKVTDTRALRQSSELAAFNSATGNAAGVKEVLLEMDDFFDVEEGGWQSIMYAPSTLPGFQSGSSVRLIWAHLDLLQPETSAVALPSVSTRNYMVLSGCLMTEGTFGAAPVLNAGMQTALLPSNAPAWKRVLDVNLDALTHQGYLVSNSAAAVEVGRLSVLNPDTGAAATGVALQARLRLRYAVSFPVTGTASVSISSVSSVTEAGVATLGSTSVFPFVQGMQAKQ